MKAELLSALDASAPSRLLTAEKTTIVVERDKFSVTGFILTDKNGFTALVDKSAVRWLTKSEMWWLMHDSNSPINL